MTFNVEAAKKAGYSDPEIQAFLNPKQDKSFNSESAKKAGYSDEEIDSFLEKQKKEEDYKPGSFFHRKERRPGGIVGAVAEHPKEALAEAAISGTVGAVESGGPLGGTFPKGSLLERLSRPPGFSPENGPTEFLRDKAGITELPPEEREELEAFSGLVNIFGPWAAQKIYSGIKNLKPSASALPKEPPSEPPPSDSSVFPKSGEPAISGEITNDLKAVGKEVKENLLGPNISEEIPQSISKERIKSTTHAGQELEKAVGEAYQDITGKINKAYHKSRNMNKNIESIHPELVDNLQKASEDFKKIPDPSAPVARFIKSVEKLDNLLVERAPDGSIIGYKPVSNQILIDQIQEYNSIPDFDFPTDTKTGIFKPLINKLNVAIEKTAANHPKAIESWQEAKNLYAERSNLFSDPDVAKWTKLTDKNYSKDFLSSIEIDKIRKLTPVLKEASHHRDILQKMKRELVREKLDKFSSVGNRFKKQEIAEELAELEAVLTKDEIAEIERLIEESRTLPAKALSIADRFYKYLRRPTKVIHDAGNIK